MVRLLRGEIDVQILAGSNLHRDFIFVFFVDPGFQEVIAGWQTRQPVHSVSRSGEIRRIQNQDHPSHMVMDFAVQFDNAWLVENHHWRSVRFAISAQVKTFRFRVGKHVVVEIVPVREAYAGTDLDRHQAGAKLSAHLPHFIRGGRCLYWFWKLPFEVNHRRGRVRWGDLARLAGIARSGTHPRLWLRQGNATFND